MTPKSIMLIAGEASGDANAAELVKALAETLPRYTDTDEVQPLTGGLRPTFFGAGGPRMAEAGVELAHDMTRESVVGLLEVAAKWRTFQRIFNKLLDLAIEREPDVIILIDFGEFNGRFAKAIRKHLRKHAGIFYNWQPKIVRYVSPQVWASRPGRAYKLPETIDLLLCLFSFEKEWYAKRVPQLKVEWVGHPIIDRHASSPPPPTSRPQPPSVVLLPGSRAGELKRHLPVMLEAARLISAKQNVRFLMILPSEAMAAQARRFGLDSIPNLEIQIGGLSQALSQATVSIASTGTVTLECAYFGVPTVAIYKTSAITYQIARRIIHVRFLAMPNLLADDVVFPELIQNEATGPKIAQETLSILTNPARHAEIQAKLKKIILSLGPTGAAHRAAQAIAKLLNGGNF